MKYNFIKTSDRETRDRLISLGFTIISESNGVTTFLNPAPKKLNFDDGKVAYTFSRSLRVMNRVMLSITRSPAFRDLT